MKKLFGFLDDFEGGRKRTVRLLGLALLMQLLDYATTKAIFILQGGTDAEFNSLGKNLFEGYSGWGLELSLVFRAVVVFLIFWLCHRLSRKPSVRFLAFDLLVVGLLIFGFSFIVLGNSVHLLGLGVVALLGSRLPAMPTGPVNTLDVIALALTFALTFSAVGAYVWRKYRRLFCFGPVVVCCWIIAYAVLNII